MKLRKDRSHLYGQSNLDFRTKQSDQPNVNTNPTKDLKAISTMKRRPFSKITNLKETISDNIYNNQKFYRTSQYFQKFNSNVEHLQTNSPERNKNLLINIKNIQQDKTKSKNFSSNKIETNKQSLIETQLVKINKDETSKNLVDLNKIREINLMIRRRYNSKKDFHRIFKQWNKSSNGELSPSEAQEMLNKFGIALNLNEIKILLSTGSRRGKETLNLDEFIQFVFPENINNNSNQYDVMEHGEEIEKIKQSNRLNCIKSNTDKDNKYIKEYIKRNLTRVCNLFKDKDITNKKTCNFNEFTSIMKGLDIPRRYVEDETLRSFFNEFNQNNNINYLIFLDKICQIKDETDFFNFQQKNLNNIEGKLEEDKKSLNNLLIENQRVILKEKERIEEMKRKYQEVLEQKEKEYKNDNINGINNMQPSAEFSKKINANSKTHFMKIEEIKECLSPNLKDIHSINFLKLDLRPKSRYGANPPHQNTFVNFQYCIEDFPISNRCWSGQVFRNTSRASPTDKNLKIKEFAKEVNDINQYKDYVTEIRRINSSINKAQKQHKHERLNCIRNEFIE